MVNTLRWWETLGGRQALRARKLHTYLLPYLVLFISPIWLFRSCILHNKPVNASKGFYWVLRAIPGNDQTWKGGCGNSGWGQVSQRPGLRLVTGMWSRGQSCGTEPFNLRDVTWLQVDTVRIELSCWTPSWCWRNEGLTGVRKHPRLVIFVTSYVNDKSSFYYEDF